MDEPKKEIISITVRYWSIKRGEYTETYPPHCQVGMCQYPSVIIEERIHVQDEFSAKTSLLYLCKDCATNLIGENRAKKLIRSSLIGDNKKVVK